MIHDLPYLVKWRLLLSGEADGATNMAIDEAILRAVAAGLVPPTLRCYGWRPPCLSLGRGQPAREVLVEVCERDGVDLVRRPTGGRAILHADELTYSVVAPQWEPRVKGGVLASYRRLSQGLLAGLERLGVPHLRADARYAHRDPEALSAVCFQVPSDYEITVGGRKLVGSAQMRAAGVVLQHGAIPLRGDIARIARYLRGAPSPRRIRDRATTVSEALGREVGWEEAAQALIAGFAQALHLELEPAELTVEERIWAEELRANKYAHPGWTFRL